MLYIPDMIVARTINPVRSKGPEPYRDGWRVTLRTQPVAQLNTVKSNDDWRDKASRTNSSYGSGELVN